MHSTLSFLHSTEWAISSAWNAFLACSSLAGRFFIFKAFPDLSMLSQASHWLEYLTHFCNALLQNLYYPFTESPWEVGTVSLFSEPWGFAGQSKSMYFINICRIRVTDGWMDSPWHSLWNIYLLAVNFVVFHYTHDNLIISLPSVFFCLNPVSLRNFLGTYFSYLLWWMMDLSSPFPCLNMTLNSVFSSLQGRQ